MRAVFGANQARPGTVNYIEGTAFLDGRPLRNQNVGNTELDAGQVLSTRRGQGGDSANAGHFFARGFKQLSKDDFSRSGANAS